MDISSDVEKIDFWGWNCKNDLIVVKKKKVQQLFKKLTVELLYDFV